MKNCPPVKECQLWSYHIDYREVLRYHSLARKRLSSKERPPPTFGPISCIGSKFTQMSSHPGASFMWLIECMLMESWEAQSHLKYETLHQKGYITRYIHVHHVSHTEHMKSSTGQNGKAWRRQRCAVLCLSRSQVSKRSKSFRCWSKYKPSPVTVILMSFIYLLSSYLTVFYISGLVH